MLLEYSTRKVSPILLIVYNSTQVGKVDKIICDIVMSPFIYYSITGY